MLRDELVLDDLIDLGSGDQLVVDGVVRSADGLMVDESLLTGESDPVLKKPGDAVFSGSFVSSGQGTYQATAIGDDAYAARLIAEAGRFQLTDSRLQAGINSILQLITYCGSHRHTHPYGHSSAAPARRFATPCCPWSPRSCPWSPRGWCS